MSEQDDNKPKLDLDPQPVAEEAPETASDPAVEQATEATAPPDETSEDAQAPVELTPEDEILKWRELALRSKADLENFRKRMTRELGDARKYANQDLLETLLPIIDNFEFGLSAAKEESEGSTIYQGMSMVQKQLKDFLSDNGVEEIAAVGLPFDPNVHEAVSKAASAEVPEGHVIVQTRRGYVLKDRLLRPAAVIVSEGEQADGAAESTETGEAAQA